MNDKELLPCPFCGGEAKITDWRLMYSVDCTVCKAGINGNRWSEEYADELEEDDYLEAVEDLRQSAIQAWNTRVKTPFHPSQLFTKGTTGSFTVNGFQLSFKDGELVSVLDFSKLPDK